ncbi:putative transmembrane protein YxlG [Lentibacillus sp. JNUCC-1]|uniref:ABC transporter permease n=1 Tax=Lentibacillus sp. JNUCC-1 TaxID=2654513 RepID=UPI0012E87DA5|nr:ABC transporter permease subunit [Lentibacillus sp. JNUCC-1]MUV38699.1 putative transmembrane protein YxlG [Lentibacillus sp. JNUCC-1]
MQWNALFRKEVLENWRNKKWIWVPLVMILIAIMDPITTYYTPMIIDSVGGLPEGSVLELPELTPPEVIMMSLSQYSLMGVLVIGLISMGTIAGERKSGVLELVLVKPVSFANYITAKWTVLLLLVWVSLFLGILASWYYINILFGDLAFTAMLQVVGFYGLWLTLVVSLAIFYNALVNNQGLVLFFTLATVMVMSIVTQIFGHVLTWSPNKLSPHIQEMLLTGQTTSDLWGSAAVTLILSIALVIGAVFIFRKKEMAA